MIKIIGILILIVVLFSCSDRSGSGKYYTNAKWQKFRKDYDQGMLKNKPVEIKESAYIELEDTLLTAKGKNGGFESYKFYTNGDLQRWQIYDSNDHWVIAEMKYDNNGLQSRYYSDRDSLRTFEDAGKVVTRKLNDSQFLMHSFFNIGPAFLLNTFRENGSIVRKEYIVDSAKLKDVFKTVIFYYKDDLLQKTTTTTKDGYQQEDNYFYSANHSLDSITRSLFNKPSQREIFTNNSYGDPVVYILQRLPKSDTIKYITFQYEYDSRGNWIKRLENKIKGNYAMSGKNPHHTLFIRKIRYTD